MTRYATQLLVIDPQNDFCDLPESCCPEVCGVKQTPALPVAGAHADMQRLAALIDSGCAGLGAITVTLDSHQHLDIAHPGFWQDANGGQVAPFTVVTAAEVRAGAFRPRLASACSRVLDYLDALEATGRYAHMIWPVHCEIGTWGQNIHHDLRQALNRWEVQHLATVAKVCKGENPWTEHYSAVKAEVIDPEDARTQLNRALIAQLQAADRVYIAGEAGSHCVKATVEHIVEHLPGEAARKLVLIEDCISAVAGFESQYAAFLSAMAERGVRIARAAEVTEALRDNA